jgi:hypothetical protein
MAIYTANVGTIGSLSGWVPDTPLSYVQPGSPSYWYDIQAVGSYASAYLEAIPAASSITSVDHYMEAYGAGGAEGVQAIIFLNGLQTNGATVRDAASWNFYQETLARPGGGAWTNADFYNSGNGFQIAVWHGNASGATVYCRLLQAKIEMNIASGGFAFLVGSLAGAALGLEEMSRLARAVYEKTNTLITPDEYMLAHADFIAHKWPSFFFMGA